jgi:hypothetical protein
LGFAETFPALAPPLALLLLVLEGFVLVDDSLLPKELLDADADVVCFCSLWFVMNCCMRFAAMPMILSEDEHTSDKLLSPKLGIKFDFAFVFDAVAVSVPLVEMAGALPLLFLLLLPGSVAGAKGTDTPLLLL